VAAPATASACGHQDQKREPEQKTKRARRCHRRPLSLLKFIGEGSFGMTLGNTVSHQSAMQPRLRDEETRSRAHNFGGIGRSQPARQAAAPVSFSTLKFKLEHQISRRGGGEATRKGFRRRDSSSAAGGGFGQLAAASLGPRTRAISVSVLRLPRLGHGFPCPERLKAALMEGCGKRPQRVRRPATLWAVRAGTTHRCRR
jgi:hypothetical protein